MSEVLTDLLFSADVTFPPLFSFDKVDSWPAEELEQCLDSGLLRPASPAKTVTCPDCHKMEEVFVVHDVTEQPHAYLRCRTHGPTQIPLEKLRQWELSPERLFDGAFGDAKLVGRRAEVVRDRVWRLGKARWAGAFRNVYFARGLQRSDAWQVINEAKLTSRSVVFVPTTPPKKDARIEAMPIVIPLIEVMTGVTRIRLDPEFVEFHIGEALARLAANSAGKNRAAPPRGSRLAVVEALTREMKEHLRTARDHASDTRDRTGTPRLLPRPQQGFLAKKLGIHKSSVSRAFNDGQANELRFLWELAADLDRILDYSGHRN